MPLIQIILLMIEIKYVYRDKIKVDDRSGGVLPIEIVNPDAIEPKARSYTCRICQVSFNFSIFFLHILMTCIVIGDIP